MSYQDSQSGSCPITVLRTWRVTDDCGNTTPVVQTITIDDTTPPSVTAPDNYTLEGCDETAITDFAYNETETGSTLAAYLALTGATATDNCNIASVSYQDSQSGSCPITVLRTWRVTDDCGNTTPVVQTITIDDTTPPSVTAPDNYTLEGCDETAITDFAYNETETGSTLAAYLALTGATATDNCNIASVSYQDSQSGSCPITVLRTWRVTDDCGNTTPVVQTITIDDTTPPSVTAPDNYTLEGCDETAITDFAYNETETGSTLAAYLALTGATATDNCNIASVSYQDSQSGSCPITVLRTWRVTDDCGNTTPVVQTITIDDTTPPSVTAPDNYTLEGCDETAITDFAYNETETGSTLAAYLALTGATATDNCNIASVSYQDSQSGSCPITVLRTWRVTDDCGNTTPVVQTITIDDTTPPSVTAPDNYTLEGCDETAITDFAYNETETGSTLAAYLALTGATATDNCNIASVSYQDSQSGSCPITVLRTWRVTDDCGNTTPVVQTITIDDTTPPSVTAPDNYTLEGCDETAITDFAYNETETGSTLAA